MATGNNHGAGDEPTKLQIDTARYYHDLRARQGAQELNRRKQQELILQAYAHREDRELLEAIFLSVNREVPDDGPPFAYVGDMEMWQPMQFTVERFHVRKTVSGVYGPPDTGKTHIMNSWTRAVGGGWRWFGWEVECAPVVYFVGERPEQFSSRNRAAREWERERGYSALPRERVRYVMKPWNVTTPIGTHWIVKHIRDTERDNGEPVRLAVMEPIYEFLPPGEELAGMIAVVPTLIAVAEVLDLAFVVGQHASLDGERARSHGNLHMLDDAHMRVERDPDDDIVLAVEKQRHAPEVAMRFRLHPYADSVVPVAFEGIGGESELLKKDYRRDRRDEVVVERQASTRRVRKQSEDEAMGDLLVKLFKHRDVPRNERAMIAMMDSGISRDRKREVIARAEQEGWLARWKSGKERLGKLTEEGCAQAELWLAGHAGKPADRSAGRTVSQ